jgi:hypothetical protein
VSINGSGVSASVLPKSRTSLQQGSDDLCGLLREKQHMQRVGGYNSTYSSAGREGGREGESRVIVSRVIVREGGREGQ